MGDLVMRRIILFCTFAGALSWTSGQGRGDSENPLQPLRNLVEQATGSGQSFINGTLYQDVYPGTNGHPFFGNGQWSEGSILTGGKTYRGVSLRYDLYKDLLIYNLIHESGIYAVNLNKERIDRFTLQGHHFVHLTNTDADPERKKPQPAAPGFYEEICTGKAALYLKWIKQYEPPSSQGDGRFIAFEQICIRKDGMLYRVTGKRTLLLVLSDQDVLIKRYIRVHGLTLRGNSAGVYQQVVEYYNSLQP